jgi:hypothetical protein
MEKPYINWTELHGKVCTVLVGQDSLEGYTTTVVNLYNPSTGEHYVVHAERTKDEG